jgi:ureidoacrylate peracid hydrolase
MYCRSGAVTLVALLSLVFPALTDERAQAQAPTTPPTYAGRQVPSSIEEILHPRHTVLIVHEMLNAFVAEGGAFDKRGARIDVSGIVDPMVKLIAAARAKNVRVAYVRWTTYPDGSTSNIWTRRPQAGTSDRQGPPSTISTNEGTWGWENLDAVKPQPGDWVLRKYRPDAFFATALDALLRWNDIRTIVIVGVGAEVGIVPTLMTASNLGYLRVAVSDCIRPTDPKRMDDAMRYIGDNATVKTHTEVIDIWKKQ